MKYHYAKVNGKWLMAGIDDKGMPVFRVMNNLEKIIYYLNPFMK